MEASEVGRLNASDPEIGAERAHRTPEGGAKMPIVPKRTVRRGRYASKVKRKNANREIGVPR